MDVTEMGFRAIRPHEVDVRVGMENENGLSLLLYKDARTDANILDETIGPDRWQCKFYEIKGTLFCTVGILPEGSAEWVWKDDCGTESNMEAQKGEASDAFKRACFKWGIGRELYTSPFIWVPESCYSKREARNGNKTCKDKFAVTVMEVKDRSISELEVVNLRTGDIVYPKCKRSKRPQEKQQEPPQAAQEPKPEQTDRSARFARIKALKERCLAAGVKEEGMRGWLEATFPGVAMKEMNVMQLRTVEEHFITCADDAEKMLGGVE